MGLGLLTAKAPVVICGFGISIAGGHEATQTPSVLVQGRMCQILLSL